MSQFYAHNWHPFDLERRMHFVAIISSSWREHLNEVASNLIGFSDGIALYNSCFIFISIALETLSKTR